jgi:hypothetical protein
MNKDEQLVGNQWDQNGWVVDYALYNGYNIVDEIDSIRTLANKPSGAGTLNTINDEAGENGNVNLTLELTTDKLKLNVHGTEKSSINVVTQADIDNMFTNLQ